MPVPFRGLERQPHAAAVLGAAVPPEGDPSHAYLLQGPAGSGKAEVARAFAVALLREPGGGAPPTDPDGVRARVEAGTHPDLTWVRPTGAAEMRVADVDGPIVAAVQRTPMEAARRVFVLERAETLNDTAANRLLKTLEEPPAYAHLLLLTDRPEDLLPTVRSRCQVVRFVGPEPDALAERLVAEHGVDRDAALACARLSLGDRRRAEALATGEGPRVRAAAEAMARHGVSRERREPTAPPPWRDLLDVATARGAAAGEQVEAAAAEAAEPLGEREQRRIVREAAEESRRASRRERTATLDLGLGVAGLWLRDVACVLHGEPSLVHHVDRADALAEDAAALRAPERALAGVREVDDTRAALRRFTGEELQLEALLARLGATLGASA